LIRVEYQSVLPVGEFSSFILYQNVGCPG